MNGWCTVRKVVDEKNKTDTTRTRLEKEMIRRDLGQKSGAKKLKREKEEKGNFDDVVDNREKVNGQWVVMAERWIGESERASPSHSTGHQFAKQLEMKKERRWIFDEKKENGRNFFALCIKGSERDFEG